MTNFTSAEFLCLFIYFLLHVFQFPSLQFIMHNDISVCQNRATYIAKEKKKTYLACEGRKLACLHGWFIGLVASLKKISSAF